MGECGWGGAVWNDVGCSGELEVGVEDEGCVGWEGFMGDGFGRDGEGRVAEAENWVGGFASGVGTWWVGVDSGDEGAGGKFGRRWEGGRWSGQLGAFSDGVECKCKGRGCLSLCFGLNFVQLELTIEDRMFTGMGVIVWDWEGGSSW